MASAYLERRKTQQKCVRCHQDAPLGQACCFDCVDKMVTDKATVRAAGLCIDCWKKPVVRGKVRCTDCLQACNQRQRDLYALRKKTGLCVHCGKHPQWHGKSICALCWAKKNHI